MCGFQGTHNRRWSARCAESLQDGSSGYEVTERKPRRRRTAQTLHSFPVTMAKGIHLFPYRTQKLSLSAPMVLGWRRSGRVGRCRIPQRKASDDVWGFFFVHPVSSFFRLFSSQRPTLYLSSSINVRHCTWLGFFLPPAVRDSGRKTWLLWRRWIMLGERIYGRITYDSGVDCKQITNSQSDMYPVFWTPVQNWIIKIPSWMLPWTWREASILF